MHMVYLFTHNSALNHLILSPDRIEFFEKTCVVLRDLSDSPELEASLK